MAGWPVDAALLRETFTIMGEGETLTGRLYGTRSRPGGRRITVTDAAGAKAFDSDECYDLGNARHELDAWLASRIATTTAR